MWLNIYVALICNFPRGYVVLFDINAAFPVRRCGYTLGSLFAQPCLFSFSNSLIQHFVTIGSPIALEIFTYNAYFSFCIHKQWNFVQQHPSDLLQRQCKCAVISEQTTRHLFSLHLVLYPIASASQRHAPTRSLLLVHVLCRGHTACITCIHRACINTCLYNLVIFSELALRKQILHQRESFILKFTYSVSLSCSQTARQVCHGSAPTNIKKVQLSVRYTIQ